MNVAFSVKAKTITDFKWSNHPRKPILAVSSVDVVRLYTKRGKLLCKIRLDGVCSALSWNPRGDCLLIIQPNLITKWTETEGKTKISINAEISLSNIVCWNSNGTRYAVGAIDGTLILVNESNGKIIGIRNHSKSISSLCWSDNDDLTSCSMDKTIHILDNNGKSKSNLKLESIPTNIKWHNSQQLLAVVANKQAIYLFPSGNLKNRVELVTIAKHGTIVDYFFVRDQVIIAQDRGYIVSLSLKPESIGQQLFGKRICNTQLNCIQVSNSLGKIVVSGDESIRLLDLEDGKVSICV